VPYRAVVSSKLAKLFGVLSHPIRVRIVEELRAQDLAVSDLTEILQITHTATSQQLRVLRISGLVVERRQGRNVYYHLPKKELADWILDGLSFISPDQEEIENMVDAIKSARNVWSGASVKKKTQQKKKTAPSVSRSATKSGGKKRA
jgi:DNA-binding transcriptional ArsR family regulator